MKKKPQLESQPALFFVRTFFACFHSLAKSSRAAGEHGSHALEAHQLLFEEKQPKKEELKASCQHLGTVSVPLDFHLMHRLTQLRLSSVSALSDQILNWESTRNLFEKPRLSVAISQVTESKAKMCFLFSANSMRFTHSRHIEKLV